MKLGFFAALTLLLPLGTIVAQERSAVPDPSAVPGTANTAPTPVAVPPAPPPAKRGFFGRVLHPFSSSPKTDSAAANYKDPKLRGLVLTVDVSPQPLKLSEVRQLDVRAVLTNRGKKAVELSFGTDQRVEIYLLNSSDAVLTKWSENHAINPQPGTVLINPGEHIEYNEKIATRELARGIVYVAEVFFPQYPELRARQKFMTAP